MGEGGRTKRRRRNGWERGETEEAGEGRGRSKRERRRESHFISEEQEEGRGRRATPTSSFFDLPLLLHA
eukprot:575832-Hanusia_phi.AAC.1